MVQTCVVASYSLAFAGGFGCYLLSMDHQTFTNLGPIAGNRPQVSLCSWSPFEMCRVDVFDCIKTIMGVAASHHTAWWTPGRVMQQSRGVMWVQHALHHYAMFCRGTMPLLPMCASG